MRLIASLIDFVMVFVGAWALELGLLRFVYGLLRGLGRTSAPFADFVDPTLLQALDVLILLWVSFGYSVLFQMRRRPIGLQARATLGKQWLGLRVAQFGSGAPMTFNQACRRWVGSGLSYVIMACGYFMVVFHPTKRSLHDLLAGTMVIYESKPVFGPRDK